MDPDTDPSTQLQSLFPRKGLAGNRSAELINTQVASQGPGKQLRNMNQQQSWPSRLADWEAGALKREVNGMD